MVVSTVAPDGPDGPPVGNGPRLHELPGATGLGGGEFECRFSAGHIGVGAGEFSLVAARRCARTNVSRKFPGAMPCAPR